MSPKKKDGTGTGTGTVLSDTQVAVIASSLCHLEGFKIDWKAVCADVGGSTPGNVQRSFKAAVAKLNLEWKDGKLTLSGGAPAAAAGPKPKGSNSSATNGDSKKRMASDDADEDSEGSDKREIVARKRVKKDASKKNSVSAEKLKEEDIDQDEQQDHQDD